MDIQKIKELALANGFKLKEQASGNMDLNAYVYDFANAIEQATKAQAVAKGFVLMKTQQEVELMKTNIQRKIEAQQVICRGFKFGTDDWVHADREYAKLIAQWNILLEVLK